MTRQCETGTMRHQVIEVPIHDESIRLGQLLKLAGVVESGVVAREVIAAGAVSVGGEPELRRGAQIPTGEKVHFDGSEYGLENVTIMPVNNA